MFRGVLERASASMLCHWLSLALALPCLYRPFTLAIKQHIIYHMLLCHTLVCMLYVHVNWCKTETGNLILPNLAPGKRVPSEGAKVWSRRMECCHVCLIYSEKSPGKRGQRRTERMARSRRGKWGGTKRRTTMTAWLWCCKTVYTKSFWNLLHINTLKFLLSNSALITGTKPHNM